VHGSIESVESIDLFQSNSPAINKNFLSHDEVSKMHPSEFVRSPSVCSSINRASRTDSVVEDLLSDIYDSRWHSSVESDALECSNSSASFQPAYDALIMRRFTESQLMTKDKSELRSVLRELQHRIQQTNSRLLRQLKVRNRRVAHITNHCNVITACLQASSLKREVNFILTQ
jgi:hypothetical protein